MPHADDDGGGYGQRKWMVETREASLCCRQTGQANDQPESSGVELDPAREPRVHPNAILKCT